MKIAGVIIEPHKLPIFKRHLDKAGFQYEVVEGPLKDTLNIKVKYEWVKDLMPAINAANEEAKS